MNRSRVLTAGLVAGLAIAGSAASAAPQKVPGCPSGFEKGSTIDFPQFAYADRNGNTLVCFKERRPGSGAYVVTDDRPSG